MKTFVMEAHLVDLADDDLKELLGHTFTALKDLAEAASTDPVLAELRAAVKKHHDENYGDTEKMLRARLKAGRALAKARGITWRLPTDKD